MRQSAERLEDRALHRPELAPFNWDDPLDLEGELTLDERMIRDTARDYVPMRGRTTFTRLFWDTR